MTAITTWFAKWVWKHRWRGLFVVAVLYFGFPAFMDSLDLPAFDPQYKCPPNAQRPDGKPDPINTVRPNSGKVFVIRLNNGGQFVDRCELTDALDELIGNKQVAFGPKWREGAKELPRLTLLYVHGWKHDDKSEDLQHFEKLVRELTDSQKDKKQVLGVYVAWNASWHLGWFNNFSFWSKERIADRIAESGALTKIISSLGAMRKKEFGTADQFITIGHSFGARMLFAAAGQTLIYETTKAHPGGPRGTYGLVRGASDAVVLLNPAFEASMYSSLDGVRRLEEHFSPQQPPLLLSISSAADDATGQLFPIGQLVGGALTEIERTTLGNYEPFATHDLTRNPDCSGNNGALSEEFLVKGLCLKRRARSDRQSQPYNPFIVARTTKDIIGDHNDIWNDDFRKWLGNFIEALEPAQRDSQKRSPTIDYQLGRVVQ